MHDDTLLRQWQHAMHDAIVGDDPRIVNQIVGDTRADAATRLRVYVDACALRLIYVLCGDFPVLADAIGSRRFEALARGYLAAQASDTPSIRWYGRHFAAWLRSRHTRPAWLAELADFEWAQGEVLDAADAPQAGVVDLARHPAERWPRLCLQLHPAQRMLRLRWNVPELWLAATSREPIRPQSDAPRHCLLWRHPDGVRWRRLDADEAATLAAAANRGTLASLGTALLRSGVTPEAVPGRLAQRLQRWLIDGLVQEITSLD